MKLHNSVEDKAHTNLDNVYKFKIKESVKSFQILSSSLYSDPVLAIIRELSTNAVDSHIAAGKPDLPIDVHLPTGLEPYFGVKDYGIGMDSDDVEVVFTTYFESTKNDNNDEMGGLGVGGKSPYSYTNNFTVTAVKDGMKRLYTAFINDDGLPELARLGEFATDDPNGVEIQVPVKPDDNRSFINKARMVYAGFDVLPQFTGEKIEPFSYDVIGELTDNVVQYKDQGYHSHNFKNAYVKMGYILYPINVDAISSLDDIAVSSTILAILKSNIVITANVGDFDIQPSREGLTYTKNNVTRIIDIAMKISSTLEKEITDNINQEYNTWEKIRLLNEYSNRDIHQLVIASVAERLNMNNFISIFTSYYSDSIRVVGKDVFTSDNDYIAKYSLSGYKDVGKLLAKKMAPLIYYGDDVVFVYPTKSTGLVTQVRRHIKATKDKRLHIIIQKLPENMVAFWNSIENPPNVLSQDQLKELPKEQRATVTPTRIDNRFNAKYIGGGSSYKILKDDNLTVGTNYYIPFERSSYPDGSVMSKLGIEDVMFSLHVFGVPVFYTTNIKQTKMVKDMKNWVRIDDFIEEEYNKFASNTELHIHNIFYDNKYSLKHYVHTDLANYDLNSMLSTYPDIVGTKYHRACSISNKYGHEIERNFAYVNTDIANHKNKYPLLKYVSHQASEECVKEYIRLIEGEKE